MVAFTLTPEKIDALIAAGRGDLVRKYHKALTPLEVFQPRPDCAEEFDQQTAFVNSKAKFAICLGGTGSGKSVAAAYKTARYLLNTPPPEERAPFWIIGQTFELTCGVCWNQKLSKFLPQSAIWKIDWYKPNRNWPHAVILRDPRDPNKPGWSIEFKSYEQGRLLMQGMEIGGYWFNEQVPLEIVDEVQWRCRKTDAPGWADFTPYDMVMSDWEVKYRERPEGWEFYHLNTERNQYIDQDFTRRKLADTPEDERATRRTGHFGAFCGQVFKEFNYAIHVIDELPATNGPKIDGIHANWKRIRGIDPGWTNPCACVWMCRDSDGRYYVYDELYEVHKRTDELVDLLKERTWRYGHPIYGQTYVDDEDPRLIADLQHLGIQNISRANKTTIIPRVSLVRSMMMVQGDARPQIYILSKCKNLIREILSYHWPSVIGKDDRRRNPSEVPVDFDNHVISAMSYGIWGEARSGNKAPESTRRHWQPSQGVQVKLNGTNGHANGRH